MAAWVVKCVHGFRTKRRRTGHGVEPCDEQQPVMVSTAVIGSKCPRRSLTIRSLAAAQDFIRDKSPIPTPCFPALGSAIGRSAAATEVRLGGAPVDHRAKNPATDVAGPCLGRNSDRKPGSAVSAATRSSTTCRYCGPITHLLRPHTQIRPPPTIGQAVPYFSSSDAFASRYMQLHY